MRAARTLIVLLTAIVALASPASAQHFGRGVPLDTTLATRVLTDSTFTVYPGVTETHIHYLNKAGKPEAVYILKARLRRGKLSMEAATPFARDTFCRQTLMESIRWEDTTGHRVIGGVNADFFDMGNGIPISMEMTHGKMLKQASRPGRGFVGVDTRGRVIIGDSALYARREKSLREALGGAQMLVENGREVPQADNAFNLTRHPRTAAGIINARTVLLVVVDGRQPDYSNGMPLGELAHLMKLLDAKTAVNLDGGGSSTLVSRDASGAWVNRNRPSGHVERAVANSWIIVAPR
jgi:hypothetical protein